MPYTPPRASYRLPPLQPRRRPAAQAPSGLLSQIALRDVDFASDVAAELAINHGLKARDFDGIKPNGKQGGYNTADVRGILAARG